MRIFVFFFIFAYNLFVINGIPYALVKFIYSKYYYYYTIARIFFLSAFFYPHFPVRNRIRDPQISGPRFTDTRVKMGRLQ